ncbi:hypothetical protein ONZ45_g5735 [Pleurotus djamor]|nr:hypothetical protein ONZ45_g5735 [Pleurotus djamor]
MTERNVGRPWNSEEDAALKQAVERYGEIDNWKNIALEVPGRTNKACRKRWLHSLSPTVKKSAWTPAEDEKLIECYTALGPRWSAIARQIVGRTDDACSKRYREALDPTLKKDDWTPEEDQKLAEVYSRVGVKWGQVGQELNRSGLACRNRWRLLERKKSAILSKRKDSAIYDHLYSPQIETLFPPQDIDLGDFSQAHSHMEHDLGDKYYYYSQPPFTFMETTCSQPQYSPETSTQHLLPQDIITRAPIAVISSFSSLENALSDPPPPPRPLPSVASTPHLAPYSLHADPDLMSPTTMSPQHSIVGLMDSQMTLVDHSQYSSPAVYAHDIQPSPHITDGGLLEDLPPPEPTNDPATFSSLEVDSPEIPQPPLSIDTNVDCDWGSRVATPAEAIVERTLQPLQPYPSTPLGHISPLSGTPSPSLISSTELPPAGTVTATPPAESLLFASSSQPQPAAPESSRTRKKKSPIQVRRILEDTKPHRLSSKLRLTADSSVLPYACGYDGCWPSDATMSTSCFATSRELSEHSKDHEDEMSNKPFRCGLAGCGKSWKSINGLQYHLQMYFPSLASALDSLTILPST